jgi:hypothetical protein
MQKYEQGYEDCIPQWAVSILIKHPCLMDSDLIMYHPDFGEKLSNIVLQLYDKYWRQKT